jgi:hypothetical protein
MWVRNEHRARRSKRQAQGSCLRQTFAAPSVLHARVSGQSVAEFMIMVQVRIYFSVAEFMIMVQVRIYFKRYWSTFMLGFKPTTGVNPYTILSSKTQACLESESTTPLRRTRVMLHLLVAKGGGGTTPLRRTRVMLHQSGRHPA